MISKGQRVFLIITGLPGNEAAPRSGDAAEEDEEDEDREVIIFK